MIDYTVEDGVAVIAIDRQDRRNALSPKAMLILRECLETFERDAATRVAILTGRGDIAFCAGADIQETLPIADRSFISVYFDREFDATHPLYIRNISLPRLGMTKPLIAAVNGVAVGGGMELAVNCDMCIASTKARFGLPEVRIGSIPAVAGIQRVMRSLPRAVAMQLILTGEIVDACKALEWGLVSEVVEPEALMLRAMELARIIANNAPLAVRAAKRLGDKASELPLAEAAELEEILWGHLYGSRDRMEGRRAFVEKRPPRFIGE